MADIRINALATTAASTASDDFVAVDGSANGTRKLNAYSPTFGGNVTASGNLTVSGTGTIGNTGNTTGNDSLKLGGKAISDGSGLYGNYGSLILNSDASFTANANPYLITNALNATSFAIIRGANATTVPTLGTNGAVTSGTVALSISNAGNTTLAGNLTVSGTGTSSVAGNLGIGTTTPDPTSAGGRALTLSGDFTRARLQLRNTDSSSVGSVAGTLQWMAGSTSLATVDVASETAANTAYLAFSTSASGTIAEAMRISATNRNLLIGTTTDGGQKLQVSGTSNFSNPGSSTIANFTNSANADFQIVLTASTSAKIGPSTPTSLILQTNGTTALTLDSSQNATFNGTILASSATGFVLNLSDTRSQAAGNGASIGLRGTYTGSSQTNFAAVLGLKVNSTDGNYAGKMVLQTRPNGGALTDALTLDDSQNATFAGTVTSTGTLKAVTNLALTTVSGYNFIGFNNANNLTTATGIYSATGDTTLYLNVPTSSTIRARINGVDKLTVSETTATFANSIAIGNTVNTVSPTSPNRTITMVIGGTTYYIHAKTTND